MYFKFHTFAISPIANGYSGNLFFIPMSLAVLWLRHMRPVSLWVIWMRQNKTKWTLKYREENNTEKKSHHKSNMFSFSSWTFFNACSKHVPHHHPVSLPHTPPVGRNGRSGCASLINYYGLVFLPVCIAAVPFFFFNFSCTHHHVSLWLGFMLCWFSVFIFLRNVRRGKLEEAGVVVWPCFFSSFPFAEIARQRRCCKR